MIKRIIIVFIVIATLAYYFDFDIRIWIERSGITQWFAAEKEGGQATSTSSLGNP